MGLELAFGGALVDDDLALLIGADEMELAGGLVWRFLRLCFLQLVEFDLLHRRPHPHQPAY